MFGLKKTNNSPRVDKLKTGLHSVTLARALNKQKLEPEAWNNRVRSLILKIPEP